MNSDAADGHYGFASDPENPGWVVRPAEQTGMFIDIFGEVRLLVEAADRVRIRIMPERRHLNIMEGVHGGFLLALIDQVYFVGPAALGIPNVIGGSTIDSSTQFMAPVTLGAPVDAIVEILRVTGRMVFIRGIIEQAGVKAVAFSGTIRKHSRAPARPS